MFNKELQTYRKIVGANLMFHREVYGVLRDLLVEHAPASLRLAARELDGMPCPVELQCNDFAQAMAKWSEPVDVI